jgi:hypothetical protein
MRTAGNVVLKERLMVRRRSISLNMTDSLDNFSQNHRTSTLISSILSLQLKLTPSISLIRSPSRNRLQKPRLITPLDRRITQNRTENRLSNISIRTVNLMRSKRSPEKSRDRRHFVIW